jgi:hypothetical protein
LVSLRLYRRWKERRKNARDRYAEMSEEQREAIDRYHRPQHRFPASGPVPREFRDP